MSPLAPPKLLLRLEGLEKSTKNLRTAGDPAEHKNNVRLLLKLGEIFFFFYCATNHGGLYFAAL